VTIKEAIKEAVTRDNAQAAGRIVDALCFKHGWNYADCAALFERCAGLNAADFEALMYRADMGY